MDFFRKHKIGTLVFSLAIAVRLALFFVNLHATNGDFISAFRGQDGYYEVSKNLIDGNGYSMDDGPIFSPEPLRPPVWIFIMALVAKIFGSYVPVFILEIILGSLIPILGMYLARRFIPSGYIPIIGVLLALDPYPILLSVLAISETCFTFLFFISLIFLFRYIENQTTRNAVWCGVFLGLAILVKPTVQFFPFLIPIAIFIIYRKSLSLVLLKHLGCFLAMCLLIITPWVYRNYKDFGAFGLSAQPAYNLYTVLVPTLLSIDTGVDYETLHAEVQKGLDRRGESVINLTNGDRRIKEAISIISEHKMVFVKSASISVVTFFTHDGMLTILGYAGKTIPNFLHKPALVLLMTDPLELARDILKYANSPGILIFLGRLLWIAITLLFFIGAGLYLKKEKPNLFAYFALAIVAYFAIMTIANGFGMNARFRAPVTVFILTFAVYGFSALWRFAKNYLNKKQISQDAQ
jgi:4-amino-4-deoxy-L-arabinose transferase-like glycosyltransferase